MGAELQSNVETTAHLEESAKDDQDAEESSPTSSAAETSISSPAAPTFSPILSMSSLTSTENSSEDSEKHPNRSKPVSNMKTYKLVGDNIDKTVKPRDVRMDNQTRSLHYFHSYAVRDRIDVSHMEDQPSLPSLESIDVTTVLPTEQDQKSMKGLFSIHVARILKKRMPFFTKFGDGLERHIKHDFFKEMSQKSEVVSKE